MIANHLHATAKWLVLAILLGATLSGSKWCGDSIAVSAEPQRAGPTAVYREVQSVLELEAAGELHDRLTELQSLSSAATGTDLAQWSMGNVKLGKKWVPFQSVVDDEAYQERLSEYRLARNRAAIAIEKQPAAVVHRQLAGWCRDHKLAQQQRLHWMKVVESDPSDADAHERLGHEFIGGIWYTSEEMQAAKEKSLNISRQLSKWLPRLKPILVAQRSTDPDHRAAAASQLKELAHPDAVPAIQIGLVLADEPLMMQLVDLLTTIGTPDAALALAQLALTDTYGAKGDAAIKGLRKLPAEFYAPALLGALSSPITQEFSFFEGTNGQLMLQQVLFRETQSRRNVQQLLKSIQFDSRQVHINVASIFSIGGQFVQSFEHIAAGPRLPSAPLSFAENLAKNSARTALNDEASLQKDQVDAANARTEDFNRRIYHVLSLATETQLPPDANAWWQWWYAQNELYVPQQKPTDFAYQVDNQVVPVTTYSVSNRGVEQFSCLVAGTVVQTAEGLRAIDSIQPGDLVLSQHPQSGELAFKPVLYTTVRPPAPIVTIETEGNVIRATGGHLFWVAGQGWVRARTLTPKMVLHDAHGTTRIRSVVPEDEKQKAYNLIVADFHTYFVSSEHVLSYDNTPLRPTIVTVPGLAAQANSLSE